MDQKETTTKCSIQITTTIGLNLVCYQIYPDRLALYWIMPNITRQNLVQHKIFLNEEERVLREIKSFGLTIHFSVSAIEAKSILRTGINDNVEPAIVELAHSKGHQDLSTPPDHGDLQTIELLRARIKRAIARADSKRTTLQNVKDLLDIQFSELCTASGQ